MSKKTDIIMVGILSAALFTGFTAYSYSVDKTKAKVQAELPTKVTTAVQTVSLQPDAAQPVPDATVTKKKTTKSKAS